MVGGWWWWLANLGPRTIGQRPEEGLLSQTETQAGEELRAKVDAALVAFDERNDQANLERLEQAVVLQERLVSELSHGGQGEERKLQQLEQRLGDVRAVTLNRRIASRDDEAGSAMVKNFVREARIERRLQELDAAPLAEEVQVALAAAR